MASAKALSLIFLALAALAAAPALAQDGADPPALGAAAPEVVKVYVEGVVFSEKCTPEQSYPLANAKPLNGATVAVLCHDGLGRLLSNVTAVTDSDKGYFLAALNMKSLALAKVEPIEACSVRLLSSGSSAYVATDLNGGSSGATLRDEGKRYSLDGVNYVIYATGPFAFQDKDSSPCPAPALPPSSPPLPEGKIKLYVEGVVYCQACDKKGTMSLTGAAPLAGAKVNVSCPAHSATATADATGYFLTAVDGIEDNVYVHQALRKCFVKPVSSPSQACSVVTKLNYGVEGAPLRDEGKRYKEDGNVTDVIFAAGPVAFAPSVC